MYGTKDPLAVVSLCVELCSASLPLASADISEKSLSCAWQRVTGRIISASLNGVGSLEVPLCTQSSPPSVCAREAILLPAARLILLSGTKLM